MAPTPHPLPPPLEPVLAFLNTVDVEEGTDLLAGGPTALVSWLGAAGLLTGTAVATAEEFLLARDLREGLRALALANNGGPADGPTVAQARDTLSRLPLVALPPPTDGAAPPLAPLHTGPVVAALGRIAAGYAVAVASGQWWRLRRCPAGDCAWVFWDSSARGGRRWCTMRVCGNRAKARAFAERRRGGGGGGGGAPA